MFQIISNAINDDIHSDFYAAIRNGPTVSYSRIRNIVSFDGVNTRKNDLKKIGLVWRNGKKISQIINDYLYLPFFLLIILCPMRSYGRADYTVLCIFALREKSIISSNEPTFFSLHTYLCLYLSLGLPSKFRSEKILRNRLGSVFVIPRK